MHESFYNRLEELGKKFDDVNELKLNIVYKEGVISVTGTGLHFTADEIMEFFSEADETEEESSSKIAQSDVPNNMLTLLAALRASTGYIPK